MMMNRGDAQVKYPGGVVGCRSPASRVRTTRGAPYWPTGVVTRSSTSQSPSTFCMVTVTWSL
jgi:hypothetical protein